MGSDIIVVGTVLEMRLSGIAIERLTAGNVVIGICVKDRGSTAVGSNDGDDEVSTLNSGGGHRAVDVMVAGTELVICEDASEELVDGSSERLIGGFCRLMRFQELQELLHDAFVGLCGVVTDRGSLLPLDLTADG